MKSEFAFAFCAVLAAVCVAGGLLTQIRARRCAGRGVGEFVAVKLSAAVAVGVVGSMAGTPVAGAYTGDEQAFLRAAASVGYSADQHTVDVGHGACKLMDQGLYGDAVDRYIADSVSSSEGSNQLFQAALLRQYAIGNLCPRHQLNYGGNI